MKATISVAVLLAFEKLLNVGLFEVASVVVVANLLELQS